MSTFLTIMYILSTVFSLYGFMPTIYDVWKKNIISANFKTYILWSLSCTITFLYMFIVNKDIVLIMISGIHLLFTVLILLGIIYRRYK